MEIALGVAAALLASLVLMSRIWPRHATAVLTALHRSLAGLRKAEIHLRGQRMAYLEGGSGTPLLLLHGIGADKDNFLRIARRLRQHFRLIVPDLPGFGESSADASGAYDIASHVKRLDDMIDALGLKHVHLGGNSMGGFIAAAYAAAHPGRVLSLWLLAPAGVKGAAPSEMMRALLEGRDLPIFARTLPETRALLKFVMHRPVWVPRCAVVTLAERQRSSYALNRSIAEQLAAGPGLDDLLQAGPRVPTLIHWGNRDRAVDVSGAQILHSLLPVSRVQVLADVGHLPMIEAPGKCIDSYLAFQQDIRHGVEEREDSGRPSTATAAGMSLPTKEPAGRPTTFAADPRNPPSADRNFP